MTIEANGISLLATSQTMTSCLPGADSGGSQGSTGLASLNESAGTLGSGSVNASPGLSPNDQANVNTINGLSFSASSLCHSAVTTAASAMGLGSPSVTDSINNNNQLRAAAAAAAAGQLNLSDCDPARFAAAGLPYPGLSAAGGAGGLGAMYAAAAGAATYPSNDQNPYPSIAMDPNNSFYSSLVSISTMYHSRAKSFFKEHSYLQVKVFTIYLFNFLYDLYAICMYELFQ